MTQNANIINIDGEIFVRQGSKPSSHTTIDADLRPYVVVRSATASPFAGYLVAKTETTVTLMKARRIRRWFGAMDLNQLATEGTTAPEKCQFGVPGIVEIPFNEIHLCTPVGAASIQAVKEWKI